MSKSRTNLLLLTTVFTIVGLVGQAWLAGKSDPAGRDGSDSRPSAAPAFLASAKAVEEPAGVPMPAPLFVAMPPQQLSDDATVLVGEMCNLQLMAEGTGLSLESNQWTAFATVVLRFQAIRHTYEAQIARLKEISPGQYQAEIPVYAGVGDELRENFSRELCASLGGPTAREVMAKLGNRLEKRFAGFGVSVQTLDIAAHPAGEPSDIQVTRTVSYWNSAEGSDRVTTRSEIHFPVLEDPTGDSWSALLAKVGEANAEDGPG